MTDPAPPAPKAPRPRRLVEESLGDVLTSSIDAFVFRDIEDEAAATAVFAFVEDEDVRATLGQALRGARWMQKAGLALARPPGHPARPTLLRSQLIDYGAIVERCLREVIRQHRPTGVPPTFQGLIQRAGETELLSQRAINAADRRREARNRCTSASTQRRSPAPRAPRR